MRRQARTGHQADRHVPPLRCAGEIDNLGLVKNGDRAALTDQFSQLIQPRLHDLRQLQATNGPSAKAQAAMRECKELPIIGGVAFGMERQQAPTRSSTVKPGQRGDLANRQLGALCIETFDHPKSLGER